jgi:hypothetical protein
LETYGADGRTWMLTQRLSWLLARLRGGLRTLELDDSLLPSLSRLDDVILSLLPRRLFLYGICDAGGEGLVAGDTDSDEAFWDDDGEEADEVATGVLRRGSGICRSRCMPINAYSGVCDTENFSSCSGCVCQLRKGDEKIAALTLN